MAKESVFSSKHIQCVSLLSDVFHMDMVKNYHMIVYIKMHNFISVSQTDKNHY